MTTSGYSGKPLWLKLGLKPGQTLHLVRETDEAVPSYWLEAPFPVLVSADTEEQMEYLHLFVVTKKELVHRALPLVPRLAKTGIWWVSWPKKASGRRSDVTEDTLREVFLPLGLVDVKVCSVTDDLWSGLKLVWRKNLR